MVCFIIEKALFFCKDLSIHLLSDICASWTIYVYYSIKFRSLKHVVCGPHAAGKMCLCGPRSPHNKYKKIKIIT